MKMPWSHNHMSGRYYHYPWDGDSDPERCPGCGASEEDGRGPDWDTEDDRLVPYGRCPTCGWSCEPCPDIEDAYERSDL
jgi:hypothetical protein